MSVNNLQDKRNFGDLEPCKGRIIRQGDDKTIIYRKVTEEPLDCCMPQLVEEKQKLIAQIMASKSPMQSAESVDETSLSCVQEEVKKEFPHEQLLAEKTEQLGKLNALLTSDASSLEQISETIQNEQIIGVMM